MKKNEIKWKNRLKNDKLVLFLSGKYVINF